MTNTYVIEPAIGEWRAAVIDSDDIARKLHFFAEDFISPMDCVFTGTVRSLEPQLDMAFIDIGQARDGMITLRRAKQLVKGRIDTINDCLQEGQRLQVQVLAEASAFEDKALPLSAKPRLLGRYLVLEAGPDRLHFSKDLPPRTVKALTPVLKPLIAGLSVIVRSTATDIDPAAVEAEMTWLAGAFKGKSDKGLDFAFSPLEQALISAPEEGDIIIDHKAAYTDARHLCKDRWPDLSNRLTLWQGEGRAFDAYGVNEEIEEALSDQIALPSGGWIAIHETPTLTAIDVNVGSALKGRPAQDAILEVNLEAAMAVAHHIRFQDIGGLIVVDFVDMAAKGAAAHLMAVIDAALKDDPVPVRHSGISQFGLVEFARKRKGISLRQRMTCPRPASARASAVAMSLVHEAEKLGLSAAPGAIELCLTQAVRTWLDSRPALTAALTARTSRPVGFKTSEKNSVSLKG